MNWQPIETAPKDGTPVIVLTWEQSGDIVAIQAHYADNEWNPIWLDMHGCGCCGSGKLDAEYWIPIPELPKR